LQEEEEERRKQEEEEEEKKRAKERVWDDIVKAGGGPIVFNATMMDGGDILALSKTHVVVSWIRDHCVVYVFVSAEEHV
jgi:hypothetical protein